MATLQALDEVGGSSSHPLEWLFELPAFATLNKAERALVLKPDQGGSRDIHAGTAETVVDSRLLLEKGAFESGKKDRLMGLRLLFAWAEREVEEGREMMWIRREVVERLKAEMWMLMGDDS